MKIREKSWLERKPIIEDLAYLERVAAILADVRSRGDAALREYSARFDRAELAAFRISAEAIKAAYMQVPTDAIEALRVAAARVEAFHRKQPLTSWITHELGGTLGQIVSPLDRVGVYVPGGTAPLPSSLLHAAIPAKVAGVKEIIVCTPPNPAAIVLVAADIAGVSAVYQVGGAQAVAALAYGTESIPKVDKIVGPGNIYVVLAKKLVFGTVGIESLPGPTETVVVADEAANPAWVAADLLAQAEHDVLASAVLLTPSGSLAKAVQAEIARRIEKLARAAIITQTFEAGSGIVLTDDVAEAVRLADAYAPEHLCLSVREPWAWVPEIHHAGGIFVGEHSFEVLGDYVAGPSHIMPTAGSARFSSPVNVWDFVRLTSLIALDAATTAQIAPAAALLAHAEGLDGHAGAAEERTAA
ncbi:MAG: histidinol dehydrogenase [Chloroflexota bacterium]